MGSLFSQPFGGTQSNSSSSNQAYPYLQGALSGTVGNGTGAGNQIANMLGLNGAPAQNAGFSNWQNSTGYQFGLNQGMQSINGNAATQGLLNSGGTLKALDTYGQNYANTQYGNYTNMLQSLLGSGNQAAGIIGSAGNKSQSTSSGTQGGIGTGIGSLLAKPGSSAGATALASIGL